ncbi:MAG TPA: ABC transporter ATP-binding protein [Acidimicrobiales bacterium]|nr:ABC transporter ATP-binding protein [Acidimicrobiales bacterium]
MLEIEDVSVSYGPAQVLFDLSLSVEAGQAVALLGSNGAGKSTLGKTIAGLVRSSAGRIHLDGQDITMMHAHDVSRLGLMYIPEGRGIFPGLSVADNLRICLRRSGSRRLVTERVEYAYEVFPILGERRNQRAGTLSGGQQQMLSLTRVLVGKPKLVIADEPSLGLAPMLVNSVFENLQRARDEGTTIILIEQFAHKALEFADHCVILQRGELTWKGPATDAKQEVLSRYLGTEVSEAQAVEGAIPPNATGP